VVEEEIVEEMRKLNNHATGDGRRKDVIESTK
jgi:hypothetical protein